MSHRLSWAAALFMLLAITGTTSAEDERKPNLQIRISAAFVQHLLGGDFERAETIDEVMLGKRVQGTGQTVGTARVQLLPNLETASLQLQWNGQMRTNTQSGEGTVVIYNEGVVPFNARQQANIDAFGVHLSQVESSAQASTELRGVGILGPMGVWPLRKLPKYTARQRFYWQKEQIESAESERAQQRIETRLASEGPLSSVGSLHSSLLGAGNPKGIRLERVSFATTSDALFVNAWTPTANQPGGQLPAPRLPRADDLALRVHQGAVNEMLFAMFASATLTPTQIRNSLAEILGPVAPAKLDDNPRDMVVRFTAQAPFVTRFHDGTIAFFLRTEDIRYEGMVFEPVDVSVTYRIVAESARRVGDVRVLPRAAAADAKLTLRQELRSGVIRRRLERIFSEAFTLNLTLPESTLLTATLAQAEDGWLLMNWDLPTAPQSVSLDRR